MDKHFLLSPFHTSLTPQWIIGQSCCLWYPWASIEAEALPSQIYTVAPWRSSTGTLTLHMLLGLSCCPKPLNFASFLPPKSTTWTSPLLPNPASSSRCNSWTRVTPMCWPWRNTYLLSLWIAGGFTSVAWVLTVTPMPHPHFSSVLDWQAHTDSWPKCLESSQCIAESVSSWHHHSPHSSWCSCLPSSHKNAH